MSKPESVAALLPTLQGKWRPGRVKTIIAGPRSTEVRVLAVVPYAVEGDA